MTPEWHHVTPCLFIFELKSVPISVSTGAKGTMYVKEV